MWEGVGGVGGWGGWGRCGRVVGEVWEGVGRWGRVGEGGNSTLKDIQLKRLDTCSIMKRNMMFKTHFGKMEVCVDQQVLVIGCHQTYHCIILHNRRATILQTLQFTPIVI